MYTVRIFLVAFFYISIKTCIAQAPSAIPYQAVVRNAAGTTLANQPVKLQFSIRDSVAAGTILYRELHTLNTNAQGLVSVNIGTGSLVSGSFTSINWGRNAKFLQAELDAQNNNVYTDLGTTQMMSVPYSLHAANGLSNGTATGETLYWNGTSWVRLAPGGYGQSLVICDGGIPQWGGCLPKVTTGTLAGITQVNASGGGNVTSDGGVPVIARGVCWGTTSNPTIAGSRTNDGSGTGSFSSNITGLTASTTYYVRAYATNNVGTAYGSEQSFATSAIALATLSTNAVSSITLNTAVCGGSITNTAGSNVTTRGVCWSTSPNPTVALSTKTQDGAGAGNFSSNITGLQENTTYYVRAYATNGAGTAYGNEQTFRTLTLPSVSTTAVTGISQTTAQSGGSINSDGGSPVTARGICWSTNPNPTVALSTKTQNGTGTGSFTSGMTGLSPSTTYYVRAYATTAMGTAYGAGISFTTNAASLAVVSPATFQYNNCSWYMTLSANVVDSGGLPLVDKGFVFSTSPNPTVASNMLVMNNSFAGSYSVRLTGIPNQVTYYFRSFARNALGITYGTETNFTLICDPNNPGDPGGGDPDIFPAQGVATTRSVSNISASSAVVSGEFGYVSTPDAPILSSGIAYSRNSIPRTSDSTVNRGTTTGSFDVTLSGLQINTSYFARTYAKTGLGTTYGAVLSFSTRDSVTIPSVTIGTQVWSSKNLDVTRYRNGDLVPQVTDPVQWSSLTTGAWCWYNNDSASSSTFGRLYNWYAITDSRGLAPTGWHIPDESDWKKLIKYLDPVADTTLNGGSTSAGGSMKAVILWNSPNTGATNSSGFTGLPGGVRSGTVGSFGDKFIHGYWWSTGQYDTNFAWIRYLYSNDSSVIRANFNKKDGISVRVLKD